MKYVYTGPKFENVTVKPVNYSEELFQQELSLESEAFFELRKLHDIRPFRILDSTEKELQDIREFFRRNSDRFFCVCVDGKLTGSVLLVGNYIQCLVIDPSCRRTGLGTELTKFAVNHALDHGADCVELDVLEGNEAAMGLYEKLGFKKCPV